MEFHVAPFPDEAHLERIVLGEPGNNPYLPSHVDHSPDHCFEGLEGIQIWERVLDEITMQLVPTCSPRGLDILNQIHIMESGVKTFNDRHDDDWTMAERIP